ncbi:recombinase family protein [Arthrobacter sp. 162MFSha1.1]|uniref:recombinase family protein n=1 Tax=Arthrobacter sp. 162MFSha1.1 TaxID=1151119 RepID=UPI00036BB70C|nr:recombinase family protein [Arthrobacter sp. 162MFSha1.1]
MALIGYARVSTAKQSLEAQENQLKEAGCSVIYSDVMTGAAASRPQWDAARKALREGDTLVITRLDRAGRSLKHLIEVSDELSQGGVALRVLDQGIDTTTSFGSLVYNILAMLGEFERETISERTRIALAARPRGRKGGRPKALSPRDQRRAQKLYDAGEMTIKEIAGALGVSQSTINRYVEKDKARTAKGGAVTSES